jgi:hypothetical protein
MSEVVNIPGRDMVALLRAEARKKPATAALMDAAQTMTDAEIDALKVPLPWYRKALKKVRDMRISSETTARMSEIIAASVQDKMLNDVGFGSMRQWNGDQTFVTVDRGGGIEIKYGQMVWFPESGGVWIDTAFSNHVDPNFANTTFVERNKRSGYIAAVAARRNGIREEVPYTVVDGAGPPSMEDRGLFRIQRH